MKKVSKGRQVVPVIATSILKKRFQGALPVTKRLVLTKVHPLTVLADLRNGCLTSLERYLAQNRGVVDREIALEIRKLIAGSAHRSRFRLVVIEHPDGPKSRGGARTGMREKTAEKYRAIATEYEERLKVEGKEYLANDALKNAGRGSRSTIQRAKRAVEQAKKIEERNAEMMERRNRALENIRMKNKR